MKIWLDDIRTGPNSWIRTYSPQEVIQLIQQNPESIVCISLDHDLGNDSVGTGYDVLYWLEEQLYTRKDAEFLSRFKLPELLVHSANPVGRRRMDAAIKSITELYRLQN